MFADINNRFFGGCIPYNEEGEKLLCLTKRFSGKGSFSKVSYFKSLYRLLDLGRNFCKISTLRFQIFLGGRIEIITKIVTQVQ